MKKRARRLPCPLQWALLASLLAGWGGALVFRRATFASNCVISWAIYVAFVLAIAIKIR